VLRRRVRAAAGACSDLPSFLERLRADGVLVRERYSQRTPGEVTGYAVALRPDGREPVWFGGGKLAPDLTLPKLQARWADGGRKTDPHLHYYPGREQRGPRLTAYERLRALKHAEIAARDAADHIAQVVHRDPTSAADAAWAAADLLTWAARLVEDRRSGPLTEAADQFERAAREVHRRTPPPTDAGRRLRNASQMLSALRLVHAGESQQVLALMAQLLRLADAVAGLREAQRRAAQAAAARAAAEWLHAATAPVAPDRYARTPVVSHVPHVQASRPGTGRPSPGRARR
jgi:hypothetical protein